MSSSSDWRNVRVKEEPVSDFEDGRRGPRDNRRREKRERCSPSPPPSHSRHKTKSHGRSRSRSPERDRNRRRERSRSREKIKDDRDQRDRRRHNSRERDRPDSSRVKQERRSRSRSPQQDRRKAPEFRARRWDGERTEDRASSSRNPGERPRDGQRERDWNNFFNPNSEMSKQAVVKREKDERERQDTLQEFGKKDDNAPPEEKEQPNFGLSGKLTEETNTFRGVVIKYSEPPEARKPNKIRWRLYPFKGKEALDVMYVHRQSAYLLGRDRKVADIPVDHPSCSKQHAVLQYRLVPYERKDGSKGRRIRPYLIDLESANGTYVNGNRIDPKRYVELFEQDILKFGYSSREYVILHDQSKDAENDSPEATPE